eukprot:TRINITY_DN19178_c0_g1_i1.p1 TRINITY_DN19178_c0_g1~~TRINITY_DN19178_c0_g1_i1.p1  ORF type:complete len:703 (+),score=55.28 TRINITY_DN19178_c0_g1_i1:277-2385(+)
MPVSVFTPLETLSALEYLQSTLFAASEGSGVSGHARSTPVTHTLPLPEFDSPMNPSSSDVPTSLSTCDVQRVGMYSISATLRQDVPHVTTSMNYACRPKTPSDVRTIILQLLTDGFLKLCSRMATSSHKDAGDGDTTGGNSSSTLRGGVLANRYKRWRQEIVHHSSTTDDITTGDVSTIHQQRTPQNDPSSLLQQVLRDEGFVVANAIKIEILERQPSYPINPSKHMGVGRCVTKTITIRTDGCTGSTLGCVGDADSGITIGARQENKQPSTHYNAENNPADDDVEDDDEDDDDSHQLPTPMAGESAHLNLMKDDGVGRSCLYPQESLTETWERHRYDTLQATTLIPIHKWWLGQHHISSTDNSHTAPSSTGRGPLWLPLLSTREVASLRAGGGCSDNGTTATQPSSLLKMHLFTNTIQAMVDACMVVLTPSLVVSSSSTSTSESSGSVQCPPRSEPAGFCIALPDVRGATVGIQRVRLWGVPNPTLETKQTSSTTLISSSSVKIPTAGLKAARERIQELQSNGSVTKNLRGRNLLAQKPQQTRRAQVNVVTLAESDDDAECVVEDVTHSVSGMSGSIVAAHNRGLDDGANYISDFIQKVSAILNQQQGRDTDDDLCRHSVLNAFNAALIGVSNTTIHNTDTRYLALVCVVMSDELINLWNSGGSEEDRGCLLYTSDAADEEDSVDLGGRRIIKKKKKMIVR